MEGTNSKITMFAHFQDYHRNHKLFRVFLIVCKLNSTFLDITEKLPAIFKFAIYICTSIKSNLALSRLLSESNSELVRSKYLQQPK